MSYDHDNPPDKATCCNMLDPNCSKVGRSKHRPRSTQLSVGFKFSRIFMYFLLCPSTRNLQQLIETVNARVQELARQIHHNDLQLERLNLEKKEAQHGRAIEPRHIFSGS